MIMNKEQLVQEVVNYLQQGASPEEVMQALVQQGLSEQDAQQVIQQAAQMAQGGGGQGGQGQEGEQGSVLAQVADQDPEMLYAILAEFSSLPPEGQQEVMATLEQALQGGGQGGERPQEAAPQQQGSGMF